MKTREAILAKIDEIVSSFDTNNEAFEGSVEEEVKALLTEIVGDSEDKMLSEADTADLLYVKDIYHYQSAAVRKVRKFLSE